MPPRSSPTRPLPAVLTAWTSAAALLLLASASAPASAEPAAPPPGSGQLPLLGLALGSLLAAGLASLMRLALMRAVPERTLEPVPASPRRDRLASLLEDNEGLAISAGLLTLTAQLLFAYAVAALWVGEDPSAARSFVVALFIAVPLVALLCEGVARALAASPLGDGLLRRGVGAFALLQLPLAPLSTAVLFTERRARALFDLPDAATPRRVVEGLRTAIEDSGLQRELGETEREIIENALWFSDVDAAAIMSPRTEIEGVPKGASLREALEIASACAHSRLPVFDENLDAVIGVFSVRDGVQAAAERRLDEDRVEQRMRPAWFVPETVRVSELLRGFRERKLEMAIVLDEYGGTAGLLTLSDILSELVGDLHDEHDETPTAEIRPVAPRVFDVDGSTRVGDVNEELELELPEVADYETLAGFVLAKLGRFPAVGERLEHEGVTWTVTRASDRRVLELRAELQHEPRASRSAEPSDRRSSNLRELAG